MKNLIMLFMLFIPFVLIAQEANDPKVGNQSEEWMNKIASDSDMRIQMMDRMLFQTRNDEAEMTKLINTMMANTEVQKILMAMQPVNSQHRNISSEPRGMSGEKLKEMEMSTTPAIPKK
jgi:hypothetical protein